MVVWSLAETDRIANANETIPLHSKRDLEKCGYAATQTSLTAEYPSTPKDGDLEKCGYAATQTKTVA